MADLALQQKLGELLASCKVQRAGSLERAAPQEIPGAGLGYKEMAGRVVELVGSAVLWFALGIVLQAQRAGEPVAWVCGRPGEGFYPPDAAEGGVDLAALVVVRCGGMPQSLRAADILMRSGAFGLVVMDLHGDSAMPLAAQTRLAGLAHKHDCALFGLTHGAAPSLGSLVSLRLSVRGERGGDDLHGVVEVLKDKRKGPGRRQREAWRGPLGLP